MGYTEVVYRYRSPLFILYGVAATLFRSQSRTLFAWNLMHRCALTCIFIGESYTQTDRDVTLYNRKTYGYIGVPTHSPTKSNSAGVAYHRSIF